ncbi:hypothetical protein GGR56DRAFT_678701 [Xylariaceae sp. FL0804]|nr:hypothetical protein GGR56DRAFT_678701 [Xylariaceae sp. FL0804]
MPRTRQFVRFTNHFMGFDRMNWEQKFAKHEDFVARDAQIQGQEDDDSYRYPLKALMRGHWLLKGDALGPDPRLIVKLAGNAEKAQGFFDWEDLQGIMQFSRDIDKLPHDLNGPDSEAEPEEDPLEADIDALKAQVASLTAGLEAVTNAILVSNDMESLRTAVSSISKKRKNTDICDKLSSPKKSPNQGQEKEDKHPLRLHFLWRGRDTYADTYEEGEIVDSDRSYCGYVDFESRAGWVFHGVFQRPFEKNVKFSGYKISDDTGPPSLGFGRSWEDYSEQARDRERERMMRWR